jgi:hypothetical protein
MSLKSGPYTCKSYESGEKTAENWAGIMRSRLASAGSATGFRAV